MKFKKTSRELIEFIDNAVTKFNCEKKKMFGAVAFFVNGNMFTGAHQDEIFLRLSEKDKEKIMKEFDEVLPFEPMPGKQMKEYISIPENIFSDPEIFNEWLGKSYNFASTIIKKPKKIKKGFRLQPDSTKP